MNNITGNHNFLSIITNIDDFLFKLEKAFCTLILVIIISITFIEIIMRYIFNATLMVGVSEITTWCFVWLGSVGCAALVKINKHIAVDYFMRRFFSKKLKKIIMTVTNLFLLIFFIFVIRSGFIFAFGQWTIASTSANIPKTFLYISIPISMILMFYHITVHSIINLHKFNMKI
jgi:TRAP-type C4-dicarboxylate transport system permease small subunit